MSQIRGSAYLLTLLFAGAYLVAMVWRPLPPSKYIGLSEQDIPSHLGGFSAIGDYGFRPEVRAALAAGSVVSRTYSDGGPPINFTLISGTDRSALHDPRGCLVGSGWRLEDDRTVSLPGTRVMARSCRAVRDVGDVSLDMVYWYLVDGQVINRVTDIRAQMLWSALVGKKDRPVHFFRFVQTSVPDSGERTRDLARLRGFAGRMWRESYSRLARTD